MSRLSQSTHAANRGGLTSIHEDHYSGYSAWEAISYPAPRTIGRPVRQLHLAARGYSNIEPLCRGDGYRKRKRSPRLSRAGWFVRENPAVRRVSGLDLGLFERRWRQSVVVRRQHEEPTSPPRANKVRESTFSAAVT